MPIPIEIRSESVLGCIDHIRELGRPSPEGAAVGGFVAVRGWLMPAPGCAPIDSIFLGLSPESRFEAIVGIERSDVRAVNGDRARFAGFAATLPVPAARGEQTLHLRVEQDGVERELVLAGALDVRDPIDPFADLGVADVAWASAIDGVFAGTEALEPDAAGIYTLDPTRPTVIRGWAASSDPPKPAREIVARTGGRYLRVLGEQPRADVAAALGAEAHASGFSVPILPSTVGVEEVHLFAIGDDDSYAPIARVRLRSTDATTSTALLEGAPISGTVDELLLDGVTLDRSRVLELNEGADLVLAGWAIDVEGPRLSGGIELFLDDAAVVQTQTDLPRPEIARAHGQGVRDCGFAVRWRVRDLEAGSHTLALRVLSANRETRATLAQFTVSLRSVAEHSA